MSDDSARRWVTHRLTAVRGTGSCRRRSLARRGTEAMRKYARRCEVMAPMVR